MKVQANLNEIEIHAKFLQSAESLDNSTNNQVSMFARTVSHW